VRLLIVGHPYMVAENQKKLAALAALPGVELSAVVPRTWRDSLQGTLRADLRTQTTIAIRARRAVWTGREQFYWYLSRDLGMIRFQPDVMLVEQGAGSLAYAQALLCRTRYAPRCKAAFFTWWNLPYEASWPLAALERFNIARSDGAIAGNADAAAIVRDHGFSGPLLVLPQLGIDVDAFGIADSSQRPDSSTGSRFTIGFVGRLVEEKGLRELLRALTDVPFEFDLLVLGRGPLAAEIRAAAATAGWADRLTMIDSVPHDQVARHLARMDVLVLPSLTRSFWKEQFGHVLIEAMACGVPAIGSRSGEIPHVVGDAGLIVDEDDAAALRDALAALAVSPERRRLLSQAGRRRVEAHYSHRRIAEQLRDFLATL
jgi:glycosyltransferase involved in cell wall biosynthesis